MKLEIIMPVIQEDESEMQDGEMDYFKSMWKENTSIDVEFLDYGYGFTEDYVDLGISNTMYFKSNTELKSLKWWNEVNLKPLNSKHLRVEIIKGGI